MGNDLSKPRVAAPDAAGCDPLNIETTDHVSQRQPKPIPTWTPPATQTPLTPPPSAGLKRPGTPEHTLNHTQRILTPPTSTNPPTPSLSPTLLGTPASHLSSFQTLCADLDFCSPTTATTTDTPCSHCYRPIPPPQQRPLPHQHEPSPPPTALRCGHILCRRCLRAVLLLSLSTDPFVPATCPACRGAAAAAALEDGMDYSAGKDAHDDTTTTTTTEETGSQQKESESQPTSSSLSSIPLAVLGQAATSPEFLAYQLKLREHHTPPEKRLYCHDRERCGMFLGGLAKPWIRARVSVCPLCGARTCKVCGGKAHQAGINRRKDGGKEGEGDVGGCERDGKEKTKGGERKVVSPAVRRRRKMAWRRGRGEMERREQMCPGRVCQGVA